MVIKVGKGIFATPEEAIYLEEIEQTKAYIKQCEGSIRRAQKDLKLSQREVHQKFIKGARENIKVRKLDIVIKKQFLEFCQSKVSVTEKE